MVVEPNRTPTAVGTIPSQTVTVGGNAKTVNVSSYFSDADNDTLTYSASSSATTYATVSVSGSIVSVTAVAAGSATITVTATDSDSETATQSFSVTVNATNRAPTTVAPIPTQTMSANGSKILNLGSYFSDPDGDTLTYVVASSKLTVATVALSGASVTLTAVAGGTATVTAQASDPAGLSVTQSFTVSVTAQANSAPSVVGTIPAQTVTVGKSAATVDVSGYFSDPGDTLTYTASSSATNKATVSVSGVTVSITPVAAGSATVTVTASDGTSSATQTISVTVVANRAPTTVGTIPAQTVNAGGGNILNLSSYFSDPDSDALSYAAVSSNGSVATVGVSGGLLTITGVAVGSATITASASDGSQSASQSISVTVNAAVSQTRQQNTRPTAVGTIPAQTLTVGGSVAGVNLTSYFSDPNGDTLTYMASSSNTGVATVGLSGSTVTVTPVAAGAATITTMGVDPGGLSATQTFTVVVNARTNSAPTAVGSIPAKTVTVGGNAKTVDVSGYFSDPDGDALTYTASSSATGNATVSVSSATVTITPVAAGSATITVTASDSSATATQTISVTVNAAVSTEQVNNPPVAEGAVATGAIPQSNRAPVTVGTIPAQTATAGGSAATVNLGSYFLDPNGDALTYVVSSSDTGVAAVGVSSATVTITPVAAGTATVTTMAADPSALSATQTFTVTVNPQSNRAPTAVGSVPSQTVMVSAGSVTVNMASYFSDPDGDTLTYTATSSHPAMATASMSGTTVSIAPIAAGASMITVTASDGSLTVTQSLMVTVNPQPNQAPVAVGTIPSQTVTIGSPAGTVNVTSYFSDPNGDTLTYTATSSHNGLAVASASGSTVSITPVATGGVSVTVVATDPSGLTAAQAFTVRVDPQPNRAPTPVGTISTQTLTVGGSTGSVNIGGSFSDPDGDTLTYAVASSDTTVAAVNLSGVTVIITPIAIGTATATATATDPDGASGTQSFTVRVNQTNVSLIPSGSIGGITLTAGGGAAELNVANHFTSLTGDTLTYATSSSDTTVATVSLSGTQLSITPIAAGTAKVQIIAADSTGTSATQTVSVVVNPQPNRAPVTVSSIGSVTVTERGDAKEINLANYFSDPDGDALTYTATSSITGKATVSVTDSTATIAPVAEGTATVTVKAADPDGLSATQTIAVTIDPAPNEAPTFSSSATFSVAENTTTVGTVIATDIDSSDSITAYAITDGEDKELFRIAAATGVLHFNDAPNFEKPTSTSGNNEYIVMVQATSGKGDRALTAEQTLTVTVTNVNEKPTAVKEFAAVLVIYGGTSENVNMASHFSDPDGDALHYSAKSDDTSKATVSVSGSVATITPVGLGTATITVTASDSGELAMTQSIDVTIGDSSDVAGFSPGQLGIPVSVLININGELQPFGDVVAIDKNLARLSGEGSGWTVANGDTLVITVNAEGSGLDVTADVSALDTTRPYPIKFIPHGNGVYTAEMVISKENLALNGLKIILVTTRDEVGNEKMVLIAGTLDNQIYPTELLPNYPNPFNPETWIPYRLKEGTDVTLTIYDAEGRVVRRFDLGHQRAGAYETRDKAVYWDGTNDLGETVAAGLYFYNLTTHDYTQTRKATIAK